MLLVPNANLSWIKRTIRPVYSWDQAIPKACFVDPEWDKSVDVYPGMVLMKTSGQNVTLLDGTGVPYGLSAFYQAPKLGIDEIEMQGVNAAAAWVMDPGAEFEIIAPAFDSEVTWTEPGDGTIALVHAYVSGAKRGKLCPADPNAGGTSADATISAKPVGRLMEVNSTSSIVIGGLYGTE